MKNFSLIILIFILNASHSYGAMSMEEKIDPAVKNYLSSHFLNATYMFCQGNQTVAIGAQGFNSLKTGSLLKQNEQMPVASITKSMTAAGILKLQDKKLLNVEDTIDKYLTVQSGIWKDNKLPTWANKVTIHYLLTHRSGIAEYFMKTKLDVAKSHDEINKDIANFAASENLTFEPGSQYSYNNTNFVLLGLIIEQVSGKKLSNFYDEEFFIPLFMRSTRLVTLEEAVKSQIEPGSTIFPIRYFVTPNNTINPIFSEAKSEFLMVPFADGGVVSTTGDLVRWHRALHNGKILSAESYKLMIKKHYQIPDRNGKRTYVGYGLFISTIWDKADVYYHSGNAYAIRAESGYIPTYQFYYSILSNTMPYIPDELRNKIDLTKPENQLDIDFFIQYIIQSIR